MVNENIIPKTETVYELKEKYEVPSFEEFMQSYEHDGNLNYADLSGGNIGMKKGYGPCYYTNSDCTCYISEGFVTLNLACPACSSRNPSVWIHRSNNCGGPMYISTNVHLKCMRCSEDGHWREWSFGCSEHKGYKKAASGRAFLDAMNLALALYPSNDRIRDIVKEISIKLIREC